MKANKEYSKAVEFDQPMTLAIGSKRMYNLTKEWIEN